MNDSEILGTIVVIAYNESIIYVFRSEKCKTDDLEMEPKALTNLQNRKIAISFSHEKLIFVLKYESIRLLNVSKKASIYVTSANRSIFRIVMGLIL